MKIQSPWMGRVRGSAGNMTGSKVYDKNVLRAKAFEVSNPNTTAQQTERSFFKELSQFVQYFSPEVLRNIFPSKPKSMSRRNALTKQLSTAFYINDGEKQFDCSSIYNLGNTPTTEINIRSAQATEDKYTINWNPEQFEDTQLTNNLLLIAIINEDKKMIYFPSGLASLNEGSIEVSLPSESWSEESLHPLCFIGKTLRSETENPVSLQNTEVLYQQKP